MYPWLLYILWTTSALSDETPSETKLQKAWWNPVGSVEVDDLNGFRIVEGDILTFDFEEDSRNAIRPKKYLWENGIIPYVWGDKFDDFEKNRILTAMKVIESDTCVRFMERKNEKSFIRFKKENKGCFAAIGKLRALEGPLPVNFQTPVCFLMLGVVVHELLHVVGLYHEQARPDRDEFIKIHWENVNPKYISDFNKRTEEQVTTFGIPYDYGSIMHYDQYSFSKNGKPTITPKVNLSIYMGQREAPSDADFEKVRRMYNCTMTLSNASTEPSTGVSSYSD